MLIISQDPDLNATLYFTKEPSLPPVTENQNLRYKAQQINNQMQDMQSSRFWVERLLLVFEEYCCLPVVS